MAIKTIRKFSYGRKGVADVRCQEHASNTLSYLAVEKKYSMMLMLMLGMAKLYYTSFQ